MLNIRNRSNDYVNVYYTSKKHLNPVLSDNNACYAGLLQVYSEMKLDTVICKPYDKKKAKTLYSVPEPKTDGKVIYSLPYTCFEEWMSICKASDLIPKAAICSNEDGKNVLTFKKVKDIPQSRLYIALCCYRWADSSSRMVYEIMENVKLGLPLFIAIQYALNTSDSYGARNSGHSFMYTERVLGLPYNKAMDLSYSLAASMYIKSLPKTGYNKSRMHVLEGANRVKPKIGGLIVEPKNLLDYNWNPLFKLDDVEKIKTMFNQIVKK